MVTPLPSVIQNIFSMPESFWKTETFPYEDFRFGPVRQKIFEKAVMPPVLCKTFFRVKNFLKHKRSRLWDFLGLSENFLAKNFILPSPLVHNFFFVTRNFLKHGRIPSLTFLAVRWKTFDEKRWIPTFFIPFRCQTFSEKQKRSLTNFFVLVLRIKNISPKPWCPPSYTSNWSIKKFSETENGSPMNFSGTMRKIFRQKLDTARLSRHFFNARNFLNVRTVTLQKFVAQFFEENLTESNHIPLLDQKFFLKPFFSWNTEGFTCEYFRHCQTKYFRQSCDGPHPVRRNFWHPSFLETQKCSPMKFFGTMTIFFVKTVRSLNQLQSKMFSIQDSFGKTSVPLRSFSFWSRETKKFNKAVMLLFQCKEIFKSTSFLKHRRLRLWNFSVLWEKIFAKAVICPLLSKKFFDTRIFPKQKRVRLWSFSAQWVKKNMMENVETRPLLSINFFAARIFLKHRGIPSRKFSFWSVLCDKNFSTERCCPLSMHKISRYQNFPETHRGLPMNFSSTVRKRFHRSCDTPPLIQIKFDISKILKNGSGPLRKISSQWFIKILTESDHFLPS